MNAVLLAPAALAALAALALPLLIHLSRKQQLRPLNFAALRWLRANPRPQKRLRLEDWPLLLTRLVLLALLALWLAQPALYGAAEKAPYVAVMPGVSAHNINAQALPQQARIHWLSQDFPTLTNSASPTTPQPITSLLRQLDAELPADVPLIILSTAQFDGADAQTLKLTRTPDWRITTDPAPQTQPAQAQAAPLLHVWANTNQQATLRYFEAAAFAWAGNHAHYLLQTEVTPPKTKNAAILWLSSTALPKPLLQWVQSGGTALLANTAPFPTELAPLPQWQDENGATLAEGATLGQGQLLRLTHAATPQAMPQLLDASFPERLRNLLQPNHTAPTRANARTYRTETGARPYPQPPLPLSTWLGVLVALIFLLERCLSLRQRQGAAA